MKILQIISEIESAKDKGSGEAVTYFYLVYLSSQKINLYFN